MSATKPTTTASASAGAAAAPQALPPSSAGSVGIDPKQKEFTASCIPALKKILVASRSFFRAMIETEGAMAKRPLNCTDPKIEAKIKALKQANFSPAEYEARLAAITSETIEGRVQFLEAGYKIIAKRIAARLPNITETVDPVKKEKMLRFILNKMPPYLFKTEFPCHEINSFLTIASNFGTPAMKKAWTVLVAGAKDGKLNLTSVDCVRHIEALCEVPIERLVSIVTEEVYGLITLLPDQPAELYVLAKQALTRSLLTFVGGMPARERSMKAPLNSLGETVESTWMTAIAAKEGTLAIPYPNLLALPPDYQSLGRKMTAVDYRALLKKYFPAIDLIFESVEKEDPGAIKLFMDEYALKIYELGLEKKLAIAVPGQCRLKDSSSPLFKAEMAPFEEVMRKPMAHPNLVLLPETFVLPHANGSITPNEYRDLLRLHCPLGFQAFENFERANGALAETFLHDHARTIYPIEADGKKRFALAVPAFSRFVPMTIDGLLSLGDLSVHALDVIAGGAMVAAAGPLNMSIAESANHANAAVDKFMEEEFTTHKDADANVKADVLEKMALADNFRRALLNVLIAGFKEK
jgi:hypothetical protein